MIIRPKQWLAQDTNAQDWIDGFCTTDWCSAEHWLVRPDARRRDLWQVAASAEAAGWLIAADEPLCPRCGMGLSPHVEGVGDVPDACDNPLAAYARRLAA